MKAVSFLHLFVQLALEFNSFYDGERGGLLIEDGMDINVLHLHDLVGSSHISYDEEHHQRVDNTFLAVLIRLRRSGYLVQEDIQHCKVVHEMCQAMYFWKGLHILFSIDNDGGTPFQFACNTLTRAKVMEVVDDILVRYTTNNDLLTTKAAIDDTINLDGLYFSIRRQPATMLGMLRVVVIVEQHQ